MRKTLKGKKDSLRSNVESCVHAGMTFAHSTKNKTPWFPVNVRGLVGKNAFIVPHSELAMHTNAAGGKVVAWVIHDGYAHIVYQKGEKCGYTDGSDSEVLSKELRDLFTKKGRLK